MTEPAAGEEPDKNMSVANIAAPQLVSLASIYEAARHWAVRDVELDKLFNAEYYEEQ